MKVALVAGEASGDNLGGALLRALQQRAPESRFFGVAGPRMAEGARLMARCLEDKSPPAGVALAYKARP